MMISSHVMIKFLQENHPDKKIFVMGTDSLLAEFKRFNMSLVAEDETSDIIIIGFDTQLTYEKLCKACDCVRHGAIYYGINPDWNCPVEGGEFIPDCGSMAKLIEASTGKFPEFFGKPSRHTLDYIIKTTGVAPEEIAIVGDRLYTDIAVAANSDGNSILVLSGESTLADVEKSPVKPTKFYCGLLWREFASTTCATSRAKTVTVFRESAGTNFAALSKSSAVMSTQKDFPSDKKPSNTSLIRAERVHFVGAAMKTFAKICRTRRLCTIPTAYRATAVSLNLSRLKLMTC